MRDARGSRAPSHALYPFAAVRTFYVFLLLFLFPLSLCPT